MGNDFFKPKQYPGMGAGKPVTPIVPVERKPVPTFVRTRQTGDKVFLVTGESYHWIQNPEIYNAVGGGLGRETMIEFSDLAGYSQGEVLTLENVEKYKVQRPDEIVKNPIIIQEGKQTVEAKAYDASTDETVPKEGHEIVKGLTSIVIPAAFLNYPLFHYTGNCIGSIREHTNKEKTPYEIVLVINGKWDGLFKDLRDTNADRVIVNEENKGYGYAMNQGIRTSVGEYIVCMNNDVMVFDYWLEDMLDALNHVDLVMATPMYGKPYARAVEANELRFSTMPSPGAMDIKTTLSDFKDFSCVATKRALFDEIGLFNEEFFAYKEDIDFMKRMEKAGKKYASTKRVNTFHIIGSTSVNMSPEDLHRAEGEAAFKKLWETPSQS